MHEQTNQKAVDKGADSLFTGEEWKQIASALHLTPRQAQIVKLLFAGKKDRYVAEELGLSVAAVRLYLRHIYAELEVSDRMGLALRVFCVVRQNGGNCEKRA